MLALYIISFVVVILYSFYYAIMLMYITLGILSFWSFLALINYLRLSQIESKRFIYHIKGYLIPFLVMFLYTIVLWLFQRNFSTSNVTRLLSTLIFLIVSIGFVISGYIYFKKRLVDILFWTLCITYTCFSIIPNLMNMGLIEFIKYIFMINILGMGNQIINLITPLEVHDLTFAIGLFLIYFIMNIKNIEHFRKTKIIISILLVIIGLKRVEIIALLIVFVLSLILKHITHVKRFYVIFSLGMIFFAIMFLIFVKNGYFVDLAEKYSIDFMGRLTLYSYASNYYEIDISFFGSGFTKFSKDFNDLYLNGFRINGHAVPASIHSNIIEQYISLGFLGFILWSYYILCHRSISFANHDRLVSNLYFLCTIYLFILYFSDNALTYTLTQATYFVLPLCVKVFDKNNDYLELI